MKGHDFLASMAARSRERANTARRAISEAELLTQIDAMSPPPPLRLGTFDIIAEVKLRSPAAGQLQARDFDRNAQIHAYAAAGACAVSVLTEPDEFNGDLAHLREAAIVLQDTQVPAMRKDFLTDPYQVLEARAAGAGGVLVIVTMLDDAVVEDLLAIASELAMFVLLEGFDRSDLRRIAAIDPSRYSQPLLAGVNCRDLTNLQVSFDRFAALQDALPDHMPSVAESGISSTDSVRSIAEAGYRLALVGSALMTSGTPAQTLREYLAAGRATLAPGLI